MATFYGLNATLRDNSVPSKKIPSTDQGGRVRVAYDEITLAGVALTTDTIKMMKLPSGARILNAVLNASALGAGSLNVGWENNGIDGAAAAGIFAATAVAAASAVSMSSTYSASQFTKFSAETQISIVPSVNTSAAGTIKLAVTYSLD